MNYDDSTADAIRSGGWELAHGLSDEELAELYYPRSEVAADAHPQLYLIVNIGCLECGEPTLNMGVTRYPGKLPVIKWGNHDPEQDPLWRGQGVMVAMELPPLVRP